MPVSISQDCGDDSRDVRSCNRRNPAVTGRPADHAVLAGRASKEVDVEVVRMNVNPIPEALMYSSVK